MTLAPLPVIDSPDAPNPADAPLPPPMFGALPDFSKKQWRHLEKILGKDAGVLNFFAKQREIQAATRALEPFRAEFQHLLEDDQAAERLQEKLLRDKEVQALAFSEEDVERAFRRVGYPIIEAMPQSKVLEILCQAAHYLADEDCRVKKSSQLWQLLPRLVAEGRPLEACLVELYVAATLQERDEVNPFLMQMFLEGLKKWDAQRFQGDLQLVKAAGFDPDQAKNMSLAEMCQWLKSQYEDPAAAARLDALLAAHPEQERRAAESIQAQDREFLGMLAQPEYRHLLPDSEELMPWVPELTEALSSLAPDLRPTENPTPEQADALIGALWPFMEKMARSLFTLERSRCLAEKLRSMVSGLRSSNNAHMATCFLRVADTIESLPGPYRDHLLTCICWLSTSAISLEGGCPDGDI